MRERSARFPVSLHTAWYERCPPFRPRPWFCRTSRPSRVAVTVPASWRRTQSAHLWRGNDQSHAPCRTPSTRYLWVSKRHRVFRVKTATQFENRDHIHRVSKTSHLCLAITWTHVNVFWYFLGRNVTDKVGNQTTLYYATSNNLTCASALLYLVNRGNAKIAFSLKCCISACIAWIQPAAWFLQSFWLTHTHATVWLPKSCNQCVQL